MIVRITLPADAQRALAEGRFVRANLGGPVLVGDVVATSALVGRVDGELRAYANVCRHRAIALDLGAADAMADDGVHLLCHQHGAIYRPTDGMCVAGPCAGERLVAIGVGDDENAILLTIGE